MSIQGTGQTTSFANRGRSGPTQNLSIRYGFDRGGDGVQIEDLAYSRRGREQNDVPASESHPCRLSIHLIASKFVTLPR